MSLFLFFLWKNEGRIRNGEVEKMNAERQDPQPGAPSTTSHSRLTPEAAGRYRTIELQCNVNRTNLNASSYPLITDYLDGSIRHEVDEVSLHIVVTSCGYVLGESDCRRLWEARNSR
jgi:hypothetical protein